MKFLKDWLFNRNLHRQFQAQKFQSGKSTNAGKHIGIVFDYKDKNDLIFLEIIKSKLKSEGKFVKILGFIDQDVKVDQFDFKAFSKKELTWEGIPKSIYVDEFLDRQYDIIFFAIRDYVRPLEYISMVSQSKLKIGTFHESLQDYFDILIDIKSQTRINDIFNHFLLHLKIMSN